MKIKLLKTTSAILYAIEISPRNDYSRMHSCRSFYNGMHCMYSPALESVK